MIQLSNISKKFGETQAVEGISLMIPDGSVFGLLGSCLLYTSDAADE